MARDAQFTVVEQPLTTVEHMTVVTFQHTSVVTMCAVVVTTSEHPGVATQAVSIWNLVVEAVKIVEALPV